MRTFVSPLAALLLTAAVSTPLTGQIHPADGPETQPVAHRHTGQTFFGSASATPALRELSTTVHDLLSDGEEEKADAVITGFLQANPRDQKAMLLRAAVVRGRPNIAAAKPLFSDVVAAGKDTEEGRCAALMLKIDAGTDMDASFQAILDLTQRPAHQDQILWMCALAAQKLGHPQEAIRQINESTFLTQDGPVSSERLYADLLDQTERSAKALPLRQSLVKIKEDSANLAGLARSLIASGDYIKAAPVAKKALEMDEKNAAAWEASARLNYSLSDFKEAEIKARKATELAPKVASAHMILARALDRLDRPGEAYDEYWRGAMGGRPLPPLAAAQRVLALPIPQAIDEVQKYFSVGRQADAEALVGRLLTSHPADAAVIFLAGVCVRSRFEVQQAAPFFLKMADVSPASAHGQCASLILQIDRRNNPNAALDQLVKLIRAHPDDVFLLWMGGIACRTLNKDDLGVELYGDLVGHFSVGPSLVHQTFGNLLDDVGQHELALAHRKMAVHVEPAGWSYQGLGISLASLYEFEGADKAYAKALQLSPGNSLYWQTWGSMLYDWSHYDDAIAKCRQAVQLNPRDARALNVWGLCLEEQAKTDEALQKFEASMKADPTSPYAFNNAANLYQKRGDNDKANAIRAQAPHR